VIKSNEFLSFLSEQVVKLISSDELKVSSEENVDKLKLINVIFDHMEGKIINLFTKVYFCWLIILLLPMFIVVGILMC